MKRMTWIACGILTSGSLALSACGDDDPLLPPGTGGTATGGVGTGGGFPSTGGVPAAGGSTGGLPGTGGALGGMGGESGGMGGMIETSDHYVCDEIDSLGMGASAGFRISSPDFGFCAPMPTETTCDGEAFGTGSSPKLKWTKGPSGTESYAIVFKDISILADEDPATERFALHWVIWDIPKDVTSLPAALMGSHLPDMPAELAGARQWGVRNEYGYLGPCPNPFPEDHPAFSPALVNDSYSFTLYALDQASLDDLPAQPIMDDMDDQTTDYAGGNWAVTMDKYLQDNALAATEYRGTSDAWATSFAPPDPVEFPCATDLSIPDDAECLAGPN